MSHHTGSKIRHDESSQQGSDMSQWVLTPSQQFITTSHNNKSVIRHNESPHRVNDPSQPVTKTSQNTVPTTHLKMLETGNIPPKYS